jgi:hypothetical protein
MSDTITNEQLAAYIHTLYFIKKVPTKEKNISMDIICCAVEDTKFLKKIASKAKSVTFENPPDAVWFLGLVGNILVGCCCCVIRNGKARCKSDFVSVESRGRGYYGLLSAIRLDYITDNFASVADCFSTSFSRHQFLKDGFKILRENNGIAYMKKIL